MNDIPIKCLRKETRDLISALLNPKKIIPNERGLSRDWHGLAELCGIGGEKIPNIEQTNDPTLKILEVWSEKNKNESTIAKLLSYLEILDRFDVVEDIAPLIEKDAEYYRAHPEGFTVELQDYDDKDIITFDDVERKRDGLPPQTYDAFVLFADDDIGFATDIINTLEGQYNMKLCEKSRDVIGGENSYDSVIRLISTRCNRVIVVVSPSFLESPTNKYFYSLAQIDGIERQRRKIIPCIYKKCLELPLEFRAYHLLDFTRTEKLFFNFWDQLYKSIKVVIPPSTRPTLPQIQPAVSNKTTEASKSTNHVKFGFVEQPPKVVEQPPKVIEPEEKEDNPIPDEVFPEVPTSAPSTPEFEHNHNELKKKNSFYRKFWKILHQKTEKDQTEVPQINMVSKKKKFWKRNKLKMAVAN